MLIAGSLQFSAVWGGVLLGWVPVIGLLILLLGFFIGSNLTVHLANAVGVRTFTALYALIACELLVLWRRRLPWLDNLRLGFVYAVVLEAFKVGS